MTSLAAMHPNQLCYWSQVSILPVCLPPQPCPAPARSTTTTSLHPLELWKGSSVHVGFWLPTPPMKSSGKQDPQQRWEMPCCTGGLKGAQFLQPTIPQGFWIKNSHPVELFCKILEETVLQWIPCLPQKGMGKSSLFPWILCSGDWKWSWSHTFWYGSYIGKGQTSPVVWEVPSHSLGCPALENHHKKPHICGWAVLKTLWRHLLITQIPWGAGRMSSTGLFAFSTFD